jgi:flagellin-like hook-associated protein FlgL
MADVTLTSGIRANLLSLQNTSSLIEDTQFKLSTGKKVNSALDDPISFFKAQSLNYRAADLTARKDSILQGLQTITAADKGIMSIIDLVDTAQSKALAAQELDTTRAYGLTTAGTAAVLTTQEAYSQMAFVQDNGWTNLSITENKEAFLENLGKMTIGTATGEVAAGNEAVKIIYTMDASTTVISANLTWDEVAENADKTATFSTITVNDLLDAMTIKFEGLTFEYDPDSTGFKVYAEDSTTRISAISSGAFLTTFGLNLTNGTNLDGTVTSLDVGKELASLENAYNDVLDQINSLADDASYAGINLLNSDALSNKLTVFFNEDLSDDSKLDVQGVNVTSVGLGLTKATWTSDTDNIDKSVDETQSARSDLRNASQSFSTAASILQTRNDFTDNMVTTLEDGSASLVNADINKESANMLALQTRQQLGTISLSIANQSEQSVLRLF